MRIFYLAATLILSLPAAVAENEGVLRVHITRVNNTKGVLRVNLFNSRDSYSKDKGPASDAFKNEIAKIEGHQATCVFNKVPIGEYAIKLFHDEDNSGTFKKNKLGVPCVQFGFSNNAKAILGPPDFKKAKFKYNGADTTIEIKMDQR